MTSGPNGFPAQSGAVQVIAGIPRVGETSIPKYRVRACAWVIPNIVWTTLSAQYAYGNLTQISIVATHIFATANLSGSIQYNCFIEDKQFFYGSEVQWNSASHIPVTCEYDPNLYFVSYTETGKYIGTLFSAYASPSCDVSIGLGAASVADYGNTTFQYTNVNLQNIVLDVISPDIEVEGNTGPARIMRWDTMSAGMQLDVAGKLWAQIIPSSALMPYVKAQQMNRGRYVPEDAEQLIRRLYDSAGTPFRRVWNLRTYKKFLLEAGCDVTREHVINWARSDDGVEEAAYDLGVFGVPGAPTRSNVSSSEGGNSGFRIRGRED